MSNLTVARVEGLRPRKCLLWIAWPRKPTP